MDITRFPAGGCLQVSVRQQGLAEGQTDRYGRHSTTDSWQQRQERKTHGRIRSCHACAVHGMDGWHADITQCDKSSCPEFIPPICSADNTYASRRPAREAQPRGWRAWHGCVCAVRRSACLCMRSGSTRRTTSCGTTGCIPRGRATLSRK